MRLLPILLASLTLAACGGADERPGGGGTAGAERREAPRLPDVRVADLAGGEVSLADLAPSRTPLLLWFWAPHCPSCNAEAPGVEAFSRRAEGKVRVVGLGAQDSAGQARDFVREHGLRTPRMLYDASLESWAHFGVNGQPAAILFDRRGVARAGWFGAFPQDEVLRLAAAL